MFLLSLPFLEVCNKFLLTKQEAYMGESWPRSWVQTERSDGWTDDRSQESPIQADYAQDVCYMACKQEKIRIRLM